MIPASTTHCYGSTGARSGDKPFHTSDVLMEHLSKFALPYQPERHVLCTTFRTNLRSDVAIQVLAQSEICEFMPVFSLKDRFGRMRKVAVDDNGETGVSTFPQPSAGS